MLFHPLFNDRNKSHPSVYFPPRNKTVIELGSGMTGLAALCIATSCKPSRVIATDGNPKAVADIRIRFHFIIRVFEQVEIVARFSLT